MFSFFVFETSQNLFSHFSPMFQLYTLQSHTRMFDVSFLAIRCRESVLNVAECRLHNNLVIAQKQTCAVVLQNRSEKFPKIHMQIPESFSKVTSCSSVTSLRKKLQQRCFSLKLTKFFGIAILRNTSGGPIFPHLTFFVRGTIRKVLVYLSFLICFRHVSKQVAMNESIVEIMKEHFVALFMVLYYIVKAWVDFFYVPRKDLKGEMVLLTGGAGDIGKLLSMKLASKGMFDTVDKFNNKYTTSSY